MKIWELTEILLIVLLHLNSIHFYQTERQSLSCREIAQAKQNLSTILISANRHRILWNEKNRRIQSALKVLLGFSEERISHLFVKDKWTMRGELDRILCSLLRFLRKIYYWWKNINGKTLSSRTFNVMVALPISTEPQCLSWSITASTTEISWEAIYWMIIKNLEATADIITFMSVFWTSVTNVWL